MARRQTEIRRCRAKEAASSPFAGMIRIRFKGSPRCLSAIGISAPCRTPLGHTEITLGPLPRQTGRTPVPARFRSTLDLERFCPTLTFGQRGDFLTLRNQTAHYVRANRLTPLRDPTRDGLRRRFVSTHRSPALRLLEAFRLWSGLLFRLEPLDDERVERARDGRDLGLPS